MIKKAFSDGLLLLPDSSKQIEGLRFALEESARAEKSTGTLVQPNTDVLLHPKVIGGAKGFREVDGRLEFDTVVSGSNTDRDGEYVNQATLSAMWDKVYKNNPILLYMHAWVDGVGHATEFWQDSASSTGEQRSYCTFRMGKGFQYQHGYGGVVMHVDDLRKKVEQDILRSVSIAFNATRVVEEEGAPRLDLTDWMETSFVVIPSYRTAQIIHLMFEGLRGHKELPANFVQMLYGMTGEIGTGDGEQQPEPKSPEPEGFDLDTDKTLQDIAATLDVDWDKAKKSIPAEPAEADGQMAVTAMLQDMVEAGRLNDARSTTQAT